MKDTLTKVVVMGSGTSTGVPVIGCDCEVCLSDDPKNKRTRASIALFDGENWYVIDTGPDFRQQILTTKITSIEGVLFTHTHADHCHGFDDLRAFSFRSTTPIPCYFLEEHLPEFKERFAYAFQDTGYTGAKPSVDLKKIPHEVFTLGKLEIEPIRLPHGHFTTCGFRIGSFAYLTDFKGFPKDWVPRWRGKIHTMVASGIHFGQHSAHNNVYETLEVFDQLEVKRGIISHLSHRVAHDIHASRLPENASFAYDGMVVDLSR